MSVFAHHVGLAGAVWALGAFGLRVAPGTGLVRVVAAVVLAAAAAVASSLLLGFVGLGGSSVALVAAAVVTWVVASRFTSPAGVREELRAWWRGLDRSHALALGGAGGLFLAWTLWLFLHPAIGRDMLLYHLPEAVQWVHGGHPGAIDQIITGLPVGNYPVTHEVLLEWGLAIGHSFVWALVVTACAPVLVAVAGWVGLRALGVDRLVAGVAVAALVATPAVVASQSGGAALDPAALGWLLSCGALAARGRAGGAPRLLAPALVAAGLAIGTKTTAAPLSILVLVLAAWPLRRALRPLIRPLGAALALAVGVGGVWYIRNTFQHGWPLWPFSSAPWGDPRPEIIAQADVKFIERPGDTLDRLGSYYVHHFGGPLLVFAGAVVAAVLARTRVVAAAAVVALASMFIWMNAPFTGVLGTRAFDVGTGDATRYLLPGAAAAFVAVALASRRGGWLRLACLGLFGAALVVNVLQAFDLGFPSVPSPGTPVAGTVFGAALVWAALRLRRPQGSRRLALRIPAPAAVVVLVLVAGAGGAIAATGFVERHGSTATRESKVAAWFADQPAWRDGSAPVASTWSLVGMLAGDRLQHPLELVDADEACARGREVGWLVIDRNQQRVQHAPGCGVRPGYEDHDFAAYGPEQLRAAPAEPAP